MSINRTSLRLAAGMLVLLMGLPVFAQDLQDMQLFAPADISSYGSGIQPKEGYFFAFDGLFWSISTPEVTTIGFPNLTRNVYYGPEETDMVIQSNTHDTGLLRGSMTEGNRIEFGRVTDRRGWLFSTYRLSDQTQMIPTTNADVVFVDDEFGPMGLKLLQGYYISDPTATPPTAIIRDLPVTFDDLLMTSRVEHWSVELMCVERMRPFHHGGIIELFAGVRNIQFDDYF